MKLETINKDLSWEKTFKEERSQALVCETLYRLMSIQYTAYVQSEIKGSTKITECMQKKVRLLLHSIDFHPIAINY